MRMAVVRPYARYNNGTALLRAGHYARAFQYLQKATVFLPSWPQLWLHLADCCIRCHVQVVPFACIPVCAVFHSPRTHMSTATEITAACEGDRGIQ